MVLKARSVISRFVLFVLKISTRILLSRWKPTIIGVTGSVGKSSFVRLLAVMLQSEFSVFATKRGNSETGIPLELLGLEWLIKERGFLHWLPVVFLAPVMAVVAPRKERVLIVEMAIDSPEKPKNMEYLLEMVKPSIGVLLNVSAAHTEQFSKLFSQHPTEDQLLNAIAHEKGKLLTALKKNEQAILSTDQDHVKKLLPNISSNVTTFGFAHSSDFIVSNTSISLQKSTFVISERATGQEYAVDLKQVVLPKAFGSSIASCFAVGVTLGLHPKKIRSILNNMNKADRDSLSLAGRSTLFEGKRGSTILDSSYNSSPTSLTEFLQIFSSLQPKRGGRKILVLGDMRELGPLTDSHHQSIVREIKNSKPDVVYLVGPIMNRVVSPKLEQLEIEVHGYASSKMVGKALAKDIRQHDLVLVKGSQNTIFLEEAVKQILKSPSQDTARLCRQQKDWMRVKADFFRQVATQ